MDELWCWRHPRAVGAEARCIGQTDLAVDPRKAKRLAHRIRATARREGLARRVAVSPLRRCRDVGQWLRRWGFEVGVDARLMELDFGAWDGRAWSEIPEPEVIAWQQNLLHHAPGGRESLWQLASRARDYATSDTPSIVVGHGGWINALKHVPPEMVVFDSMHWPAPPGHSALSRIATHRSNRLCAIALIHFDRLTSRLPVE